MDSSRGQGVKNWPAVVEVGSSHACWASESAVVGFPRGSAVAAGGVVVVVVVVICCC